MKKIDMLNEENRVLIEERKGLNEENRYVK
jgi:hypothetical protein